MSIKRYTIAAFIFMIFVGWFVEVNISQDIRSINFFGVQLPPMPIGLWVVLPLFVLYLASLLHMGSCSISKMMELRRYRKDYDELIDALHGALLGKKNRRTSYKTERYSILGNIIDKSTIVPTSKLKESDNADLQGVLDFIKDVENGEAVDLRKFHLENDNPLAVKYHTHRYENGDVIAEDILSKPERFSVDLANKAYKDFVLSAPISTIVKYQKYMSKDALVSILGRIDADENPLKIDNDTLLELIQKIEVSEDEYICGSIILAQRMMPEERIDLFERLSETNDDATAAFIYTLYDLEVVERANDLLDTSREDEYPQFRAYRALKEANKQFSINLFTPRVCR
ncbi:MAG: hypothetical protein U9R50_04380 [Campylobacterota bacterium]|nr:hypothetical protein [Campylobacterota bacterium]